MGVVMSNLPEIFQKLSPHLILILGDRYEIFAASVVALIYRIPIAHIHGGESTEGSFDDAMRHSITKMSNLHFASTLEYKKKTGKYFEYLPAPLDKTKFEKIVNVEKNPKQIAYVGRDSFEKGIDILRKIESQINGSVKFCTDLPWDETMKILKSSEMLVVPSRTESIPQVIKEAFYLKVPVIATNVGGIPELVTHEKTGILVPSEEPEQLTIAINNLLDNDKTRRNIANNAFEFINNNFSWDVLLEKYTNLYES